MNNKNNITAPADFRQKLVDAMAALYELFELSKEHSLEPVTKEGVTVYMEEYGKTCFQVSGQFDRPTEYLQSLLDMIRVNFEPYPFGTLLLNANLWELYEGIPDTPFQLGYVSLISEGHKPFEDFWQDDVTPYLEHCGYSISEASVVYVVASTGTETYNVEFLDEIAHTLKSGYSLDEAQQLLGSQLNDDIDPPTKAVYSGFCLDPALKDSTRLSLWFFLNPPEHRVQ
mgnify:CR=1 FL=1